MALGGVRAKADEKNILRLQLFFELVHCDAKSRARAHILAKAFAIGVEPVRFRLVLLRPEEQPLAWREVGAVPNTAQLNIPGTENDEILRRDLRVVLHSAQ